MPVHHFKAIFVATDPQDTDLLELRLAAALDRSVTACASLQARASYVRRGDLLIVTLQVEGFPVLNRRVFFHDLNRHLFLDRRAGDIGGFSEHPYLLGLGVWRLKRRGRR
jgi:hypothetical protein